MNASFSTFSLRNIVSKMKPDKNLYHKFYMTVKGAKSLTDKQINEAIKIIDKDSKKAIEYLENLKSK